MARNTKRLIKFAAFIYAANQVKKAKANKTYPDQINDTADKNTNFLHHSRLFACKCTTGSQIVEKLIYSIEDSSESLDVDILKTLTENSGADKNFQAFYPKNVSSREYNLIWSFIHKHGDIDVIMFMKAVYKVMDDLKSVGTSSHHLPFSEINKLFTTILSSTKYLETTIIKLNNYTTRAVVGISNAKTRIEVYATKIMHAYTTIWYELWSNIASCTDIQVFKNVYSLLLSWMSNVYNKELQTEKTVDVQPLYQAIYTVEKTATLLKAEMSTYKMKPWPIKVLLTLFFNFYFFKLREMQDEIWSCENIIASNKSTIAENNNSIHELTSIIKCIKKNQETLLKINIIPQ